MSPVEFFASSSGHFESEYQVIPKRAPLVLCTDGISPLPPTRIAALITRDETEPKVICLVPKSQQSRVLTLWKTGFIKVSCPLVVRFVT